MLCCILHEERTENERRKQRNTRQASMCGIKASAQHRLPFGTHTLPAIASAVVEPEYVILHEEAPLLVGYQLKHLHSKIESQHHNSNLQLGNSLGGKDVYCRDGLPD